MRRRTLLAALTVGAGSIAGCNAVPSLGTPTAGPDELPDVTLEYRRHGAMSRVESTTLTVEDGSLGWATTCRGDDAVGIDIERSLAAEEYVALQRQVVRSEPATWQGEYPCRDVCGTDDGTTELTVTVDGTTHDASIDPAAQLPAELSALTERLDDLQDRFDDLGPCHVGDR